MNIDTIRDRDTWLAFRADWRARYKEVSADIRSVRREIASHRAQRRALGTAGEQHRYAADSLQSGLWWRKAQANDMMLQLAEAKELKAELMAAREALAA